MMFPPLSKELHSKLRPSNGWQLTAGSCKACLWALILQGRLHLPAEKMRLRAELIAHYKASGDGWQRRIDAALRQFIDEQASAS